MNPCTFQMASIVAAGKKAMQLSEPIQYSPSKTDGNIKFAFLPQKEILRTEKYIAPNVSAWFEQIKRLEIEDIKLFCPVSEKERQALVFLPISMTTEVSAIQCFHKTGKVTYFVADCEIEVIDSNHYKLNTLYSEHDWPNPLLKEPHFENNTDSFRDVLLSIKDFATKLKFEFYAERFNLAINFLDGNNEYSDEQCLKLPPIPQQNLQLFEAASMADVFGSRGSWNDDPLIMVTNSNNKELAEEYDRLSDELMKNIRLAIMYAINEW